MRAVTFGLLAAAFFGAGAGAVLAEDGALPEAAQQAVERRDWPEVVRALSVVAESSESSSVHYWLGVAHARGGNPKAALVHVERARSLDPTDPATVVMRALLLGEAERDPKVNPLADDPRSLPEISWAHGYAWDAWYGRLLDVYRDAPWRHSPGALDILSHAAFSALEEAVEAADHEDAALLRRAGFHALERGYAEKAVAYTKRALGAEPGGWEVHLQLARALTKVGRHGEAAHHFDLGIARAPLSSNPQIPSLRAGAAFSRGLALLEAGRPADAVEAFRALLQIDIGFVPGRHYLGRAAFEAGDLELALWAFGESKAADKDWTAGYWTGRCFQRLGRHDLAERLLQSTIDEADVFDAKAGEKGEVHRNVPTEWRHWLARSQWENGKRADAVKTVLSRSWGDLDLAYGRWAFRACLDMDDPYGAIAVCDGIAARYPDAALEGLRAVLSKWPVPRLADMVSGRKAPHTVHAHLALAALHESRGELFTAADHYVAGDYLAGTWRLLPSGPVNGAWTLLHAGRSAQALAAFDAIGKGSKALRGRATLGGACAALRLGRAGEVARRLEGFAHVEEAPNADALRLWAGVADGAAAPKGPLDAWTLLGVVASAPDDGVRIDEVLPGGAMDRGPLPLRRGDWIMRIGSLWKEGDTLAALRSAPVPVAPVRVTIRRGRRELTVDVDLAAAQARAQGGVAPPPSSPAMEAR